MKHNNISIFIPHKGCKNTCSFCNQRTISGGEHAPDAEEVDEILAKASKDIKEKEETEIAFFGGSFTAIDPEYMRSLLQAAQPYIGENRFYGIRISTRPDAVDRQILALLKSYSVTSIELGAQSMDDHVLEMNHRGHTAADVENASRLIREAGISLGLQMMTGLYGDTPEGARKTAKKLIGLSPDTVRIYPAIVLKDTLLAELYRKNIYAPMELEESVTLCSELLALFLKEKIKVIRMGLHASESVEEQMLAGAYHPAFREMCESRIYLNRALSLLKNEKNFEGSLVVNNRAISKMIGQNKSNLLELQRLGYSQLKVRGDEAIELFDLRLERNVPSCF